MKRTRRLLSNRTRNHAQVLALTTGVSPERPATSNAHTHTRTHGRSAPQSAPGFCCVQPLPVRHQRTHAHQSVATMYIHACTMAVLPKLRPMNLVPILLRNDGLGGGSSVARMDNPCASRSHTLQREPFVRTVQSSSSSSSRCDSFKIQ
jgi:hypothetical protein